MSKTLHLKYPEYSRQKYKAFLEICEAGFNHLQKSAAAGQPQAPKQPKAINVSDSRWWFRVVPKYPINLFIDTAQFSVSANSPAIFAKPVPIWTLKLLNIGPVLFLERWETPGAVSMGSVTSVIDASLWGKVNGVDSATLPCGTLLC